MLPNTDVLTDRQGLIVGIAKVRSIAAGCARAHRGSGADQRLSDQSERMVEVPKVCAPMHWLTTLEEAGAMAACRVSDLGRSVTGNTAHIEGVNHVV